MKVTDIKNARNFNGTVVSVDDIVTITVDYVDASLYNEISGRRFVGRVQALADDGLQLDCSKVFRSNVQTIYYQKIVKIEKEEAK